MKKRLTFLFILAGFSTFSFSFQCSSHTAAPVAKVTKKATKHSGIAPLADLALLPALNG